MDVSPDEGLVPNAWSGEFPCPAPEPSRVLPPEVDFAPDPRVDLPRRADADPTLAACGFAVRKSRNHPILRAAASFGAHSNRS